MALTWGDSGNWVTMDAQNDVIRGAQRVKSVAWYATGASAGSTLLELIELSNSSRIIKAVAEGTQFTKEFSGPDGEINGIKLSDLDAGHVVVYFEERANINPKKLHDETAAGA